MKKFFKFVGSITLLCATVAGGIFAYKKFFAPDPFEDDFDDDFDDPQEEDLEISGRGYVSLTSEEDTDGEEAEEQKAEDAEKETEAGTEA